MIILHKDNPIYQVSNDYMERFVGTDRDNKYTWNHIGGFYYKKFEHLFQSLNLDYKLTYYEDYPDVDGEYFFGRFAHAPFDRSLHIPCYYELEKRFENIWPTKLTYELYDEKIKQFEYLDLIGHSNLIDYRVVNTFEELYNKVEVGDVVKSRVGASSGNVFLITESKYCGYDNLYELVHQCDDSKYFFPAIIQPYYEGLVYKLFVTNNFVYCKRWNENCDTTHPLNFGVGHPNKKWVNTNQTLDSNLITDDELCKISIYKECLDIRERLGTPNLCFDFIETDEGGKLLEFSYLYTEPIPAVSHYGRYNFDKNKFETVEENMEEISYNQTVSVLKEFNLI